MTGALAVRIAAQTKQKSAGQAVHAAKNRAPKPVQKPDFLQRMERELGLSPEQKERVEKALAESHKRTRALWEPLQPQFRSEVARVEGEIRSCLKPEQVSKFDELIKPRVIAKSDDNSEERRGKDAKPLRAPTVRPPMIPAPAGEKRAGGTNSAPKAAAPVQAPPTP